MRKCNLDLAPEAPWRCPDHCHGLRAPAGRRRTGPTARWSRRPRPPEPPGVDDGSAAAVLDEAEDILNAVGPEVLAEVQAEQAKQGFFKRIFRRKRLSPLTT